MSASTPDTEADTTAKQARRGFRVAMRWAVAGALCASGAWAVGLVATFALLRLPLLATDITNTLEASLTLGGAGVLTGLLAGVAVGLSRGGSHPVLVATVLGLIGILTGVIGGGLSAPAIVALDPWVHPVISSALAWALAGLIAGLIGYDWSQWAQPPTPSDEEAEPEADESAPAPRRVEWLLRQRERRLRDWPLFRVLPVLVVSAFLLVGAAALAPTSMALMLAAVGALGLAATLVLQVQETRLRRLEARLRDLERGFRPTREEDV